MSRERYQSPIELMAYDDGYQQGKADAIDELYSMLYDKLYEGNIVDNQVMHIIKLYAEQIKGVK